MLDVVAHGKRVDSSQAAIKGSSFNHSENCYMGRAYSLTQDAGFSGYRFVWEHPFGGSA